MPRRPVLIVGAVHRISLIFTGVDEVCECDATADGGDDVDIDVVRAPGPEHLAVEAGPRPLPDNARAAPEVVDRQILGVVIGQDVDAAVQEECGPVDRAHIDVRGPADALEQERAGCSRPCSP